MRITIKIQSFTDLITNSSSETFIINTDLSEEAFMKVYEDLLLKLGYEGSEYIPDSVWHTDGEISLLYIVNNMDEDITSALRLVFGKKNVKVRY